MVEGMLIRSFRAKRSSSGWSSRPGPAEFIAALGSLFEEAMDRGVLRKADPKVTALQFLGLVTAETGLRLYQRDPPSLAHLQIREMVKRAIDMFLAGAGPR